jgi:aminoglycoside phosphotransferase (APT) family kinase protein
VTDLPWSRGRPAVIFLPENRAFPASEGRQESSVISELVVIRDWFREHVGGEILNLRQQARWRPVWLVDVQRDGQILTLMVRGERVDAPLVFPLRHEMTLQRLLGEGGIPVPEVYGWIDELPAYVMDRIPGVPHFEGSTDAERRQVVREYMTLLARLHRLDVEAFAAEGIARAEHPGLSATVGMAAFERLYRQAKRRPDPFLEFALGWLRRNPLPSRPREAPIVWDSGQFHHEHGRITGLLDVEIGHIGDPMMDLAAFRMRDTVLHYGDFDEMYSIYADAGGFDLDMEAIQHHHVAFTLTNQLSFHGALAAPTPGSNYMTNLQWCVETNRHAVEALAEVLHLDLSDVEIPEAGISTVAVAHQVRTLGSVKADDEYLTYVLRGAFRLAATCSGPMRSVPPSKPQTSTTSGPCSGTVPARQPRRTLRSRPSCWRTRAGTTNRSSNCSTDASPVSTPRWDQPARR